MNITEEAVEAAALQLFLRQSNTNGPDLTHIWRQELGEYLRESFLRDARAALVAAAPFIAAQALREAATSLHAASGALEVGIVAEALNSRANRIEDSK